MSNPNSPFNWRSQPSVLSTDKDINGENRRRSEQASRLKKTPFIIGKNDPRTPHNQVNVYGRARVA